jgi:hypothetical protein
MSKNNRITVSVQPLQYADIPACARISAASFSTDKHTIVKQLGRKPFNMEAITRDGLVASLDRKTFLYVKAVDEESGEIVGHAGWGFRGVDEEMIPRTGPTDEPLKEE